MSRADVAVAQVALIYSAAAGGLGLLAVRLWRRHSIRGFLVACSAITVLSMVAGVLGAAQAMFISAHDLAVVLPVTAMASMVAMPVSWLLGRTVVRDVQGVRAVARSGTRGGGPVTLRELADIEAEVTHAQQRLVTARERVRVARKLAEFPVIDDALRRGSVSYSKVRALLRVATPANEMLLLDHARLMTASQLEKLSKG